MLLEDDVGPGAGRREIVRRRELRRGLEEAGEHRRLGEGDVAYRLAEIELRGRLDAEGAAAHIGAVEVELEDLVLGELALQPEREVCFLDLALERPLARQEEVLGELLGDRGAALHDAARLGIACDGAEGADDVDAEMVVEAAILGREHCLDDIVGHLAQLHAVIVTDAALAESRCRSDRGR